MEDALTTALQGIAVSLGSIAATLASVYAWQRKGKSDKQHEHGAGQSVVSVKEADRRVAQAKDELSRATEFAELRKMVEEHHKDDEMAFARHEKEIDSLRQHRHQIDNEITALQFGLVATDRHLAETRVQAAIDTSIKPNPLLQPPPRRKKVER